jgi:hypothetical protein
MKRGDIVKFKREVDPGDTELRMVLIDDPEKGRVMVQVIDDMPSPHPATYVHPVEELEVVLEGETWRDLCFDGCRVNMQIDDVPACKELPG